MIKLKKSIHYNDAVTQVSSNTTERKSGTKILEKHPKRFGIVKTLKKRYNSGLVKTFYLDEKDELVYPSYGDTPVIGVLEETNEEIEIEV